MSDRKTKKVIPFDFSMIRFAKKNTRPCRNILTLDSDGNHGVCHTINCNYAHSIEEFVAPPGLCCYTCSSHRYPNLPMFNDALHGRIKKKHEHTPDIALLDTDFPSLPTTKQHKTLRR